MGIKTKWDWMDLLLVLALICVLFGGIRLLIVGTGMGVWLAEVGLNGWVTLGLYLLQTAVILVPFYFLVVRRYKVNWKDLGFRWIGWKKLIKYAILGYVGYLVLSGLLLNFLWSLGLDEIPGFQKQQPILPFFGEENWQVMIGFVVIAMIAPIVEEMFFRGFMLPTLVKNLNVFWGSVLTAAIFALIHFELQIVIPIFILGLILNGLFLKSRSLWPGIGFHVLNNVLAFSVEWAMLQGWIPELEEFAMGVFMFFWDFWWKQKTDFIWTKSVISINY